MKIEMLKTSAGPSGAFVKGYIYEFTQAKALKLIKDGVAKAHASEEDIVYEKAVVPSDREIKISHDLDFLDTMSKQALISHARDNGIMLSSKQTQSKKVEILEYIRERIINE
jgi:hypothetical protein